jgi:hypothetical protein
MLIEQEMSGLGYARAASSSQQTEAPPRNMMVFGVFVCAIAALVPFAGIGFAPCLIVLGAFGLRNARRDSHYRAERRAIYSMVLGVVLFSAQLLFVYWFLLFGVR